MIKRTIALAVLATLASGAAFAQSTVTLYGRLNVTAERQKIGSAKAVYDLSNNSSRLGLKGEEDLGGGLKAGFILEHGFDPTTGAGAATFWGRQSEAYLSSNFGMVRIGNFSSEAQLATGDWVSMHNHDTGTSADRLYAYFGSDVNKVAYRAPTFVKNLTLEASAAEGSSTTKRTYDLAANYELGALKLGAGYNKQGDQKQVALRAMYDIGAFTLGTYVQRDTNGIAAGSRNNLRLAGMYTMGASEFHANVGVAGKIGSIANSKATQATIGYNYNLSKRTKVYTYYTRFNDGAAAVYGGDFSSLAVGLRHNF
ncbi:porin [uncultured Sphaerotilus sp.]|uniref:porin n=1 Tax=uncultured Sphaerotilus sp. TaxID=474984 RepID=UPI0030CA1534